MKTALIQLDSAYGKKGCLSRSELFIARAAAQGADIVCLPELFCCEYRKQAIIDAAETADGELVSFLSDTAKRHGVYLIGGSIPLREGDALYNASFVFGRDGEQLTVYKKLHLFDISVPTVTMRESDFFCAGNKLGLFETEFGTLGVCICFDLRFPELFRLLALKGAKAVFCPAAFSSSTGDAHWEVTLRARAIDNQLFVCGCSPARNEALSYVSYGHSMIASPWGVPLAQAQSTECMLLCDLDLSETDRVRSELPLLGNRRSDLYTLSLS